MKLQLSLCPGLLLMGLIALPGCASSEPASPPAEKPSYFAEGRHTSTSEVVAVDTAARTITLREPKEQPETYVVGHEVHNLEQVKPGDRVTVGYYEATSIKVLPPGAVVNDYNSSIDRSKGTEKPSAMASRYRTSTETVASVFPDTAEVVTRDAKDRLTTWHVRDVKKLDNVHSGDRVQLTYTSMLAVRVSPAPPATTTAAGPTPATP